MYVYIRKLIKAGYYEAELPGAIKKSRFQLVK